MNEQTVGRNSERFRHLTSQATAFGGTALRSALRAKKLGVSEEVIAEAERDLA